MVSIRVIPRSVLTLVEVGGVVVIAFHGPPFDKQRQSCIIRACIELDGPHDNSFETKRFITYRAVNFPYTCGGTFFRAII